MNGRDRGETAEHDRRTTETETETETATAKTTTAEKLKPQTGRNASGWCA